MSGMKSKPVPKCNACGFKFFTITDTCWKNVDSSFFLIHEKIKNLWSMSREIVQFELFHGKRKKFNTKISCRAELVVKCDAFFSK